jgi:hypothetical protein
MQIGVHPSFEDGDAAELFEIRRVSVLVEGAGDKHVEIRIACLSCSG